MIAQSEIAQATFVSLLTLRSSLQIGIFMIGVKFYQAHLAKRDVLIDSIFSIIMEHDQPHKMHV
jgi:hypothetical protein